MWLGMKSRRAARILPVARRRTGPDNHTTGVWQEMPGPHEAFCIRRARHVTHLMRLSIIWRPMCPTPALTTSLRRSGERLTRPRKSVAVLIDQRDGHFTSADLVSDARRKGVPVGRATIFRTLELFAELGVVERIDLPTGEH